MQFHEREKLDLYHFTSFVAWTILNFLPHYDLFTLVLLFCLQFYLVCLQFWLKFVYNISDDAILPFDAITIKARTSKRRRKSSLESFTKTDKKRKQYKDEFMMEEEEVKKELNPDEFDDHDLTTFSVKMDHESLEKLLPDQDKKYKCPLCKAKFKDKEVLSNHFASHKFCHKCGKSFGVGNKCDRDFLRHVKKCGKSHTCSRCGAEFPYKSYLVRHQEKSKCANNECKQTADNLKLT